MFLFIDHEYFDKKLELFWCWSWWSLGWTMLGLGLTLDHASLLKKCWNFIVLSLTWSSSNLLVFWYDDGMNPILFTCFYGMV